MYVFYLRERAQSGRGAEGEGGRERQRERERGGEEVKQAPCSARSLMRGSIP